MRPVLLILIPLSLACRPAAPPDAAPTQEPTHPASERSDHTLDLWGQVIPDPYHWLETLAAPEVQAWVEAQNAYTTPHLQSLPGREAFVNRLVELWEHDGHGTPVMREGRRFATFRAAGADQAVLRVQTEADGEPRVLLDPNTWTEDGTRALTGWVPSPNGERVAYGTADAGSDWNTWYVVDVASGEVLPDELSWVKFSSAAWLPDSSGFFYSRYPEPETGAYEEKLAHQQIWFHRVGTPQTDDQLILADPDHPTWGFWASVDDDDRRLLIHVREGTDPRNRLWTLDLDTLDLSRPAVHHDPALRPVRDGFDAAWRAIGSQGDRLFLLTDLDAPTRRVVAVDLDAPTEGEPDAIPILPARPDATLTDALLADGHLIATWLTDARSEVTVHRLDGALQHTVTLPTHGTVSGWTGERDDPRAFFRFEAFSRPAAIYTLTPASGEIAVEVPSSLSIDEEGFTTSRTTFTSRDGTPVSLFLVHRRDLTPSEPHPTLLYGYGGFNIPLTPRFQAENLAWMEQGGVLAIANLRGGGEYGRDWHQAGTRLHKQNVFDDFIAAAEHLIDTGWTSPQHLGIHGRSNGGLLVGATLTQRPDLFAAAIPGVGVLDMLKYHTWTIGWAWASDYGTVDDSEEMFQALLAYSPVHNARPASYPPTLIMTADHDDRVVPSHSYKFAAALQAAQRGPAPILIRIETRGGHGAGAPVRMRVQESADRLAFLAAHTGLEVTSQ